MKINLSIATRYLEDMQRFRYRCILCGSPTDDDSTFLCEDCKEKKP